MLGMGVGLGVGGWGRRLWGPVLAYLNLLFISPPFSTLTGPLYFIGYSKQPSVTLSWTLNLFSRK